MIGHSILVAPGSGVEQILGSGAEQVLPLLAEWTSWFRRSGRLDLVDGGEAAAAEFAADELVVGGRVPLDRGGRRAGGVLADLEDGAGVAGHVVGAAVSDAWPVAPLGGVPAHLVGHVRLLRWWGARSLRGSSPR